VVREIRDAWHDRDIDVSNEGKSIVVTKNSRCRGYVFQTKLALRKFEERLVALNIDDKATGQDDGVSASGS
jgi:hypothetical protein